MYKIKEQKPLRALVAGAEGGTLLEQIKSLDYVIRLDQRLYEFTTDLAEIKSNKSNFQSIQIPNLIY